MKEEFTFGHLCGTFIVVAFIGVGIGLLGGIKLEEQFWQRQCVERGLAQYNPVTAKFEFFLPKK